MTMRQWADRAPSLFGRPWIPTAGIALALLLASPALGVGPMGDDYMLMARVDPRLHVPGFQYAPLDLFTFASGDPAQREVLREEGVFGWWMAPDFRMAFWRPLSSLTHVVDQRLWPHSSALAHVHSLAWFGLLLAVIAGLYRRFHAPWVAGLALVLYAVDDARGWVLGWTANRNALVAAALAFAALLAHDRARRDAWRAGSWLAPALFAAALLGGEAALGVAGYFLAHALFVDSGPLRRRLARLWPYTALAFAWLLAYRGLGYGTAGGGMYLNPLDEPVEYLRASVERLPVLLAAQTGFSVADAWLVLPASARLVGWTLALVWLALVGFVLAPLWRRSPVCRFWTTGAVLSLPPVCATYPMDRLLVLAGVGAMAVVASGIAEWLNGDAFAVRTRARRVLTSGVVFLFVVFHLVLAPLLLPLRVWSIGFIARMASRLETSIPADESVHGKTLVILSSAAEFTTFPPWMERQERGLPRPRRMRLLATSMGRLEVSRLDATTLRIRPEHGFMDHDALRIVRGPSRPFHPGDEAVLSDLRVRVREVTADGRPAVADLSFAVPLEDPSLLWKRLQAGGALVPWSPPAVGESVTLPSIAPRPR
jgi:hypothetical protein